MKNLYLIGFMGCGKTYLGQELAGRWGREWVETDAAIEAQEGMSVAEIFSRRGEEYFRQKETQLLKQLTANGLIVSCGGGMATRPENVDLMRTNGVVIFLDTPFDVCYGRVLQNDARPLANERTPAEFRELYLKRRMIYLMQMDELLDGSGTIEQKMKELDKLKEHYQW